MTLQRVTASPIVSQGGECMSSFYDEKGTMVLACSGPSALRRGDLRRHQKPDAAVQQNRRAFTTATSSSSTIPTSPARTPTT